jgi:hypothetical protein
MKEMKLFLKEPEGERKEMKLLKDLNEKERQINQWTRRDVKKIKINKKSSF